MNFENLTPIKTEHFDIQRSVVAYKTTQSWQNVPHVSYIYEPNVTGVINELKKMNSENSINNKVSINTLIIKLIVEGIKAASHLNSFIEYNKGIGSIHQIKEINISLPWTLDDGRMITPAILNANEMTLQQLSNYIAEISKKIKLTNIDEVLYQAVVVETINKLKRLDLQTLLQVISSKLDKNTILRGLSGKAKQEYYAIPEDKRLGVRDIRSGTITVSNIGSLYKEQKGFVSMLEIIPPQIIAIGIGALQERAGIVTNSKGKKEVEIIETIPMCIAFDHRAIDFDAIVPFLKKMDNIFENPSSIRKL